jgi:uncharacterized protein
MRKDVDSSALKRLLEVQQHDSAIARLDHRRASLPEAQRLDGLKATLSELDADLEIARKQHDEVVRRQTWIEGELGMLEQKTQREEGRLYSGAVSNPKELSALQSEVAMLKTQRASLEDELLEVMVQRDQAKSTVDSLEKEREQVGAEADGLSKEVSALAGDIETELAQHRAARAGLIPDIPDDLLSLYEDLRQQKGGVGAAALNGSTCEGCHTKLPAREVERVRSEGGLQRCDNCRRILVV